MEDLYSYPSLSTGCDANQKFILTRIVADHRERDSGVVQALSNMENVEVRIEHLSLGDYFVDDIFLFEHKTMMDLTASIKDARLFRQACKLAGDSRRAAFVLEGTALDLCSSKMRREAIQGALITVTLMLGLPLLRALDAAETARLMVYAARQARAWSTGALPRRIRRPKGKRRAQLQMLQGLPGIGPERAARLLDAFGSVESVLTASSDELQTVDQIGATTADAIRWVVCDGSAQYTVHSEGRLLQ